MLSLLQSNQQCGPPNCVGITMVCASRLANISTKISCGVNAPNDMDWRNDLIWFLLMNDFFNISYFQLSEEVWILNDYTSNCNLLHFVIRLNLFTTIFMINFKQLSRFGPFAYRFKYCSWFGWTALDTKNFLFASMASCYSALQPSCPPSYIEEFAPSFL